MQACRVGYWGLRRAPTPSPRGLRLEDPPALLPSPWWNSPSRKQSVYVRNGALNSDTSSVECI